MERAINHNELLVKKRVIEKVTLDNLRRRRSPIDTIYNIIAITICTQFLRDSALYCNIISIGKDQTKAGRVNFE
jgi:hypothetical protein